MTFRGSCTDMCPEAERQFRFGSSISIFERDKENQPDEYAMVKEYRRSSADQKEPASSDLRTPEALSRTMDYLVCNIMDDSRSSTQELALEWYDFLWDRLRAIRKDITQQNICDQASAILVERCARFHVHSCYAMSQVKNFDVDMNKRNLNDCLQMLRQIYNDLRMTTGTVCPNELEFQLYDILLHLNDDHLASTVLMKTSDYRSSGEMIFITSIIIAYTNNDYYKFFQLMRRANYMTSCILSLYSTKMRLTGLKSIINACAPRQTTLYPFELAVKSLGFDDNEDLKLFATHFDVEIQEKHGDLFLCLNRELIKILRLSEPSSSYRFKSKQLVEEKANGLPVGLLVDGRDKLPENPYRVTPITFKKPVVPKKQEQERPTSMEFQEETQINQNFEPIFSFNHDTPFPPRLQLHNVSHEQPLPAVPFSAKLSPKRHTESPEIVCQSKPKHIPALAQPAILDSPLSIPAPSVSTPSPEKCELPEVVEYSSPVENTEQLQPDISSPDHLEAPSDEESLQRDLKLKERQREIADIMPAGRYKIRSLSSKVPTLRMPSMSNGHASPAKRAKPMNTPRRDLESLIVSMQDEARINEMTAQLLAGLGSNINTLIS